MLPHFYFNDGIFDYGFGESHPLKPERLHRMFALLDRYLVDYVTIAPPAEWEDLRRAHSERYLEAVQEISRKLGSKETDRILELRTRFGFWGDNPAFPEMDQAAAAYCGASIAAARAVAEGAPLAFGIGGGLHHAMVEKASGFCIYNDCAVACSILRERFAKVAYVDIDVHPGDGVHAIFEEDPTVLTCSIHESGRTLWPGTCWLGDTGIEFSSLNVPLDAWTTRDVWLQTFRNTILPVLRIWEPDAIVLQIGADSHHKDPLAHIQSDQSAWLAAIMDVQSLRTPLVVLGGGGYNLTTVPRMWASAVLSLAGVPFNDAISADLHARLGAQTFSDPDYNFRTSGEAAGRAAQAFVEQNHLRAHRLNRG